MGSATDYFENLILDAMLGDDHAVNMPDVVYIGLFVEEPGDSASGLEVDSVDTGYARVAVQNDSDNWPNATSGVKVNGMPVEFPVALDSWGTIGWFGVFDEEEDGNLLVWGEIATDITPEAGNAPFFGAGALAITCD